MARVRHTAHVMRSLQALGLTDAEVQGAIGNFQTRSVDEESGLRLAVAEVRGHVLRVAYPADEAGLVVVSVAMQVDDERND